LEGWRPEEFLRDGRAAQGPLWKRSSAAELGLSFSKATIDFLMLLVSEKSGEIAAETRTTGDLFVLFLAYQAVRTTEIGARWRRRRPFVEHGLCALAFPDDFADFPSAPPPNMQPWLSGVGAVILEAWQRRLAMQWAEVELSKREIVNPDRLRKLARAQDRVLSVFLEEADRHGRRDLTKFLLLAAKSVLSRCPLADDRFEKLNVGGLSTSERFEVYRDAVSVLRRLLMLRAWRRQAEAIGYVDEGYAAAQYWKAEWERLDGERLCKAAEAIVRQAEPL
jgi:hypothetical protein